MTLKEWDTQIGPYLRDAEGYARWIAFGARGLESVIRLMPARPSWETKAMAGMEEAERELRRALEIVAACKLMLADKPVAA